MIKAGISDRPEMEIELLQQPVSWLNLSVLS